VKEIKSHKSFFGKTSFFEHESTSTQTPMKFAVFCPPESVETKGGLIWLSGLTCNEENFITKAGAQKYLSELGLVLICPDTSPRGLDLENEHQDYDFGSGAGFYLDALTPAYSQHYRMHQYITEELYGIFNQKFSLKNNIGIFGHSMGGHGALVLALQHSNLFASVSAFSPIVNPCLAPWGKKAFSGYLGDDESLWAKWDTCELLKQGKKHPQEILISQGLADEFLEEQLLTKNFEEAAEQASQNHQVEYCEGYDHSYYFIASFVEQHLMHHARILSQVK